MQLPSRRHLLLYALLLTLLLVAGCGSGGGSDTITAAQAYALAQNRELTIVDIRTPQEWRATGVGEGVTPLTMHHPLGVAGFAAAMTKLVSGEKSRPIALICQTGNRSARMQRYLSEQGFTEVLDISEGMAGSFGKRGWIRSGLPVEAYPR